MKRLLTTALLAILAGPAFAADVGVSISVGEPGFYGRIDLGDFPRPEVIYQQPIIVHRVPERVAPIYLRVPPGYAKHWSRHCHEYNACGKPVYFVRDRWYNDVYVPRYRERHGYRGDRRDDYRGDRRDDRRNERDGGHGRGPHGDGPPGLERRDRD